MIRVRSSQACRHPQVLAPRQLHALTPHLPRTLGNVSAKPYCVQNRRRRPNAVVGPVKSAEWMAVLVENPMSIAVECVVIAENPTAREGIAKNQRSSALMPGIKSYIARLIRYNTYYCRANLPVVISNDSESNPPPRQTTRCRYLVGRWQLLLVLEYQSDSISRTENSEKGNNQARTIN
jgi:hypothetical protein